MLRSLSIRDFVIVDRLELEFTPGFTALTGETGAGKSILIEALALALGGRADALVVRQGGGRAEVSAEFDATGDAQISRWLEANELGGDDGACLMRRVVDSSGRSRAFINGRAVTLAQLREAGESLVDIHGQHQHQSLLRAATQRELLDAFGGLHALAADVARAHGLWRQRQEQRIRHERDADAVAAEREQLQWQARELEALGFAVGEWSALTAEHARLTHGASLAEAAQYSLDTLSEAEVSGLTQLNRAIARIEPLVAFDPELLAVLELLQPAQAQLKEAIYALRRYGEGLDLDPERLRDVERRLDAVHAAARKYRVDPEALPQLLEQCRTRLEALDAGADPEALRRAEDEALAECTSLARKLSAARARTAARLGAQVTEAMQKLAMAGGRFEVALCPVDTVTREGFEEIEMRVAAHKGVAPQPLSRVASGGELSRLSLAIQTVLSDVAHVPTLIFDEVDAGIGGRVAAIVGRLMKQLGRRHQVMCVTHLPQVAAAADHQWQVSKSAVSGVIQSRVAVLDDAQRVEEIARMLGGIKITDTTRRHAAEMLGAAGRPH